MNDKNKTAQEVPVQEQFVANISFDEIMLKDKLARINYLAQELKKEIDSLPSTLKITYQNS